MNRLIYIFTTGLLLFAGCTKDKNQITVTTNVITNIGITSVYGEASVLKTSDAICFDRGICWDTLPHPSFDINHDIEGSGYGDFSFDIRGLSAQTRYYLRAYARSVDDIFYGNQLEFMTQPPFYPGVLTGELADITNNSVVCNGKVLDDSGAEVTERGFCWSSQKSNPTLDGGSYIYKITEGLGKGMFSSKITGLEPNMKYYIRAYAMNTVGVGYGQVKQFSTKGR